LTQEEEIVKIGTKVKMVNCSEAETYPDKIWTTRSEPWRLGHGEEVVLLEGKAGGFAIRCLQVVDG
jgi:hypothetical protein